IQTFQVVATAQGYYRLSPDLTKIQDPILLQRLYRNFVFSYMRKRILLEMRQAGAVAARAKNTTTYKRRKSLTTIRYRSILLAGWPKIVAKLAAERYCHSDDEVDPVDGQYFVRPKTVRSDNATNFFRAIDE
ncbi:hypothetical protein C8R43DRAFT_855058, partial [Mycena crocata]